MSTEKVPDSEDAPTVGNEHTGEFGFRIRNPLHGVPHDVLRKRVHAFAQAKQLEDHVDILIKGALLAQDPQGFEKMEWIDENDREILRREERFNLPPPPALGKLAILCLLTTLISGWDTTNAAGANAVWPTLFGLADQTGVPTSSGNSWKIGLVFAAPYISACLFCWLMDPMNNYLGRKMTVWLLTLVCVLASLGSAFTQTWQQLLACRLILGLGFGPKSGSVALYAAELAPTRWRGQILQMTDGTSLGIFLGSLANLICYHIPHISWRAQIASVLVPCIPTLLLLLPLPESPRWLMKNGRYREAFDSFKTYRYCELQAARDLYYTHVHWEKESPAVDANSGRTYFSRFTDLFTIPRIRRATLATFSVMFAQQISGINLLGYYSSVFLLNTGHPIELTLGIGALCGVVFFASGLTAFFSQDNIGKRPFLIIAFGNLIWSMFVTGMTFLIPEGNNARVPVIMVWIFISGAIFSIGGGPLPYDYCAEVFPLRHRDMGMAWATSTHFMWLSALLLTTPPFTVAATPSGAFGFYAVLNIIGVCLIIFFVPEPKQISLEELDDVFSIPTKKHVQYQLHVAIPYFVGRWILGQKNLVKPPFYIKDSYEPASDFPQEKNEQVEQSDLSNTNSINSLKT